MSTPALLVEVLCEELPPKALAKLGEAFASALAKGLAKRELLAEGTSTHAFATPRRLAARITNVKRESQSRPVQIKLMPAAVALDADGKPTQALSRKLESLGLAGTDVASMHRRTEGKSEVLFVDSTTPATKLASALQQALDDAIAQLPIPKVMSYQLADGMTTVQFVRPAHGLVALHGADIVPVKALGLEAGRVTHGHRFQGARDISLANADEYEGRLEDEGAVIADFAVRRAAISAKLREKSAQLTGPLRAARGAAGRSHRAGGAPRGLSRRVRRGVPLGAAGMPRAHDAAEPEVFPAAGRGGKLLPRFMIVSNMRLTTPAPSCRATRGSSVRAWPTRASSSRPTRRRSSPIAWRSSRPSSTTTSWARRRSGWSGCASSPWRSRSRCRAARRARIGRTAPRSSRRPTS
jgi:glycyl-tRNA synthetase beta chain